MQFDPCGMNKIAHENRKASPKVDMLCNFCVQASMDNDDDDDDDDDDNKKKNDKDNID